jgi:hypothetical protein
MFAGKLRQLRRPASSEPAALEGGLGKAKPSMVASAVSESFPFSPRTKWERTFSIAFLLITLDED